MTASETRETKRAVMGPGYVNICAVLVTYFPDGHFLERLDKIRSQVNGVVIVDNTGEVNPAPFLNELGARKIEMIRNRDNLGIGEALNQGLQRAEALGYEWAVTFDQDTWVRPELVETLIRIYEQQPRPERVGIIGCNYEDENLGTSPHQHRVDGPASVEAVSVITSGSLLSLVTYSAAGPFRADFFIDYVDHEYCLRLRKLGYKVILATKPLMVHALGEASELNLLGLVKLILTNRSPLRRYYMTRNGLLVVGRYFLSEPLWAIETLGSILGFALLKIPFEKKQRWKKIRATAYGAIDGLLSRTGKVKASWMQV
jgi:rhamnosyltransferase